MSDPDALLRRSYFDKEMSDPSMARSPAARIAEKIWTVSQPVSLRRYVRCAAALVGGETILAFYFE